MAYAVDIGDALALVPPDVLRCLREALDELAAVIAALPPGSTFVSLVRGEMLRLDLLGWRFLYEVDTDRSRLRVVDAQPQK